MPPLPPTFSLSYSNVPSRLPAPHPPLLTPLPLCPSSICITATTIYLTPTIPAYYLPPSIGQEYTKSICIVQIYSDAWRYMSTSLPGSPTNPPISGGIPRTFWIVSAVASPQSVVPPCGGIPPVPSLWGGHHSGLHNKKKYGLYDRQI